MNSKQLISLILSFLMLGTKVSYALNIHYCGEQIAEVTFAYSEANCYMEKQKNHKAYLETKISKKSCCNDSTVLFQNHEPQKTDLEVFHETTILKTITFFPFYTSDLRLSLVSKGFSKWKPPPPKSDKLFLFQGSFIFYD